MPGNFQGILLLSQGLAFGVQMGKKGLGSDWSCVFCPACWSKLTLRKLNCLLQYGSASRIPESNGHQWEPAVSIWVYSEILHVRPHLSAYALVVAVVVAAAACKPQILNVGIAAAGLQCSWFGQRA